MPSLRDELIRASSDGHDNNSNGIEDPGYDPLQDVTEMFGNPGSLADIDELMAYTNGYKLELERQVQSHQQEYNAQLAKAGDPLQELSSMESQLDELVSNFNATKMLAEETGTTINLMTANIKELDNCKRNLTLAMTILKRLQMLVTAYESLERFLDNVGEGAADSARRDYRQIRQLLSVVLELMQHFQTYKSIDEINELNKKIGSLKNRVIDEIFKDFELELDDRLDNDTLVDACEILGMLGDAYKQKLTNWYVNSAFKELTSIFKSSEEAGSLDNLNRRFIFFQRILGNFERQHAKNFPKNWNMPITLTQKFCEITKEDLREVTAKETRLNGDRGVDSNLLLAALSDTLELENWLNKKFELYSDFGDDTKYTFDKTISTVFEPYLNVWIDHQGVALDRKLMEYLNPSNMYKKSGIAEGENMMEEKKNDAGSGAAASDDDNTVLATESINVLESAADLFRTYRQILSQLAKLTRGEPLVRLASLFSKYLSQYEKRILEPMVPRDDKAVAGGNAKEQEEYVDVICLVLNTADYCSVTTSQLEAKMQSLIRPPELATKINMESTKDIFLQMVTHCMMTLNGKIARDLQYSWREMANSNWKMLKEVTGESRYVTSLKSTLTEDCELIFSKLNKSFYIRNFIDRLIDSVLNEIILNIIKLQPITETMAEQLVLDLQTLKSFFLELPLKAPNGAKIKASPSYNKFVNAKIHEIVSLLKVLMVPHKPTDSYIDNYFYNIGDSSFDNFVKTLKMKGLLRNGATAEKDKFKYLDQFKSQLRAYQDSNADTLLDSNPFMESLDLSGQTRQPHSPRQASPPSRFPSLTTGSPTSPSVGSNISSFFNTSGSNFKSTRDNLEKNFAKTFEGNRLNENFRNSFGKFFKKPANGGGAQ